VMESSDLSRGSPETWLYDRLGKAAPRDGTPVRRDDHLRDDLAIDSLAFIELMVDFEETFQVEIDLADLLPSRYETVDDLVSHIAKYLPVK
jgi:acyl carrier protein